MVIKLAECNNKKRRFSRVRGRQRASRGGRFFLLLVFHGPASFLFIPYYTVKYPPLPPPPATMYPSLEPLPCVLAEAAARNTRSNPFDER